MTLRSLRPATTTALLLLLSAGAADADCAQVPLGHEIRDAPTIVVATLIDLRGSTARFRVDEVYKGRVGREVQIEIGRAFFVSETKRGHRFVLFLGAREDGHYRINRCGSSGSERVDELVRRLRDAGLRPSPPAPG